jgi:CheY-like chemotaxis protein
MMTSPDLCSVLVVDNDRDAALLLQVLLERRGFVVRLAYSVAMAHEEVEKAPIDVLVSDLLFSDGNGCDLLQQLRAKGPLHAIALSARDQGDDIRRCLEAGFQVFLSKPVTSLELLTAIQQRRDG